MPGPCSLADRSGFAIVEIGQKSDFSETFRGATHIVKFYDSGEYPHLATNEYFCLKTAEAAGLTVPLYHLAKDGSAFVMERFDLRLDGS